MESGKCQDYVSGNSGMCRCSGMELVVVVVWVVVFVVVWVVIVNHDGDDGLDGVVDIGHGNGMVIELA
jgi:hypothetical protein